MKRLLAAALLLWVGPAVAQMNTYNPQLVPGGALPNAVTAANMVLTTPTADRFTISGTTLPAPLAGILGLGGVAPVPTMGANGEGDVFLHNTFGLVLMGKGSTADVTLVNSGGTPVCDVLTGTTVLNCATAALSGVLPAQAVNTLGLGGTSGNPTLGANSEGDIYLGVTTGLILIGKGSTNDLTVFNSQATVVMSIPTQTASPAFPGVTTGTNADFVCMAAGGVLTLQTTACTISSMRFKNLIDGYRFGALDTLTRLEPIVFTMKPMEKPNPDANYDRPQIGLSAENVAAIEPRCAIYEDDGVTPKSYRQECLIAVLVAGMQAQQREIEALKAR